MAKKNGLAMVALSDHDCILGVAEALAQGKECGLTVIPAVEFDCEYAHELHMLGEDIDPENEELIEALRLSAKRRQERNARIVEQLETAGLHIRPYLNKTEGIVTRMHIGLALQEAGYALDVKDAFARYLSPGQVGYYHAPRYTPAEAVRIIKRAGGIPVLAHPCNVNSNPHRLIAEMVEAGIEGIEAYHPSASAGEAELLLSLARRYRLLVTCGSDFHGDNRKNVTLGCMWRELPELEKTYQLLLKRHPN